MAPKSDLERERLLANPEDVEGQGAAANADDVETSAMAPSSDGDAYGDDDDFLSQPEPRSLPLALTSFSRFVVLTFSIVFVAKSLQHYGGSVAAYADLVFIFITLFWNGGVLLAIVGRALTSFRSRRGSKQAATGPPAGKKSTTSLPYVSVSIVVGARKMAFGGPNLFGVLIYLVDTVLGAVVLTCTIVALCDGAWRWARNGDRETIFVMAFFVSGIQMLMGVIRALEKRYRPAITLALRGDGPAYRIRLPEPVPTARGAVSVHA